MPVQCLQASAGTSYKPGSVRWGMTTQKKVWTKNVVSVEEDMYTNIVLTVELRIILQFLEVAFLPHTEWNYWQAVDLGKTTYSS